MITKTHNRRIRLSELYCIRCSWRADGARYNSVSLNVPPSIFMSDCASYSLNVIWGLASSEGDLLPVGHDGRIRVSKLGSMPHTQPRDDV